MKPSKRPCPNNGGSAPCHCSPKLIRLLQHRKVPDAPPATRLRHDLKENGILGPSNSQNFPLRAQPWWARSGSPGACAAISGFWPRSCKVRNILTQVDRTEIGPPRILLGF